jgi:hypothetical protein
MLCPVFGTRRKLVMKIAKSLFLLGVDPYLGNDQEIAVAVKIASSECK